MGQGISEVLTFAIGVAISPVPIIAVILMLFSQAGERAGLPARLGLGARRCQHRRLRDLGPEQRLDQQQRLGHDLLGEDRVRCALPAPGRTSMAEQARPGRRARDAEVDGGDRHAHAGKALGLGLLLDGVNPKNLILTLGAATGLAQLGLSTTDVVVSLIVFVLVAASRSQAPSSTTSSVATTRRCGSTR